MTKAQAAKLKKGDIIRYDNLLWKVDHVCEGYNGFILSAELERRRGNPDFYSIRVIDSKGQYKYIDHKKAKLVEDEGNLPRV